jgi:UDP-N-acetylmuramoylalanine--D-glutamate ligase
MPLTPPPTLAPLLAKPVAILGGGVSGEAVLVLLGALGLEGKIYDAKGVEFTAAAARQHGLVISSPGFPPEHAWLARAAAAGLECLGEMDFASCFWHGQVVAITGTNGKTTLTEFLTHALRGVGRAAVATGNIGHPFAQLVAEKKGGARDAIAVCEVSSFQAETLKHFHADATLWTNFAEDHLERHPGLESYFGAKWNLVAHTPAEAGKSGVFIGSSVRRFAQKFDRPLASVNGVATEAQAPDPKLAGTVFAAYPQRENFILAAAWWRHAGYDLDELYRAARTFRLGRHRLARVAEHEGVVYWNDSKATNFHAVEAALAGFNAPVVLIAGGKLKGGDLAGFVHRIADRVKHVVLIGEASGELAFHCSAFRVAHTSCGSFAEAVRRATELAAPGDQVLLSPGFASFDMFRSYEDRGNQFENLVRDLAHSEAAAAARRPV